MSNRAFLNIYLPVSKLSEDEINYFKAYQNYQKNYNEERHKDIINKAQELSYLWDDNFNEYPNQVPVYTSIEHEGKIYISPDISFTKHKTISLEHKNEIPSIWLSIFNENEFKGKVCIDNTTYYDYRFVTNVEKVIERLKSYKDISIKRELQYFFIDNLDDFKDCVIELDFSEVIGGSYRSLDDYLRTVRYYSTKRYVTEAMKEIEYGL